MLVIVKINNVKTFVGHHLLHVWETITDKVASQIPKKLYEKFETFHFS